MYTIGDKIVYPMHGAGVIEAIEEKLVLGETNRYYILSLPFGEMKIMIPCDSNTHEGVREVIKETDIPLIEEALKEDSTEMSTNWNRRYHDNMEKLKTGEPCNICEVIRNLMRVNKIKKLSTGEKKMLSTAKQILISELIYVCDRDIDEITQHIEDLVLGEC